MFQKVPFEACFVTCFCYLVVCCPDIVEYLVLCSNFSPLGSCARALFCLDLCDRQKPVLRFRPVAMILTLNLRLVLFPLSGDEALMQNDAVTHQIRTEFFPFAC